LTTSNYFELSGLNLESESIIILGHQALSPPLHYPCFDEGLVLALLVTNQIDNVILLAKGKGIPGSF
jgi:hypothetical protein